MSRITVTERGRKMQKDILQEFADKSNLSPKKKESPNSLNTSKIKSPRSSSAGHNSRTLDVHNEKNLTIHQTIVRDLSHLESEDNYRSPKIRLPEIAEHKYLKIKAEKILKDLNKSLKPSEKLDSSSLPLLTTLQHTSNISSKHIGIIDHSSHLQSSYLGNSTRFMPESDKFMVSQHYKLLHLESTIAKMVERHQESQKKILDTATKVLTNFEKSRKKVIDDNHKPPVFLESIQEENADAIEVLMRKTNSHFRKRKRIAQYWRGKYEPDWDKYDDMKTEKFAHTLADVRDKKGHREDYYDYLISTNRKSEILVKPRKQI
jgi:hypothetical protein